MSVSTPGRSPHSLLKYFPGSAHSGAASDGRGNLPGEGAGGGHPFCPARGYDNGERCKLPHRDAKAFLR